MRMSVLADIYDRFQINHMLKFAISHIVDEISTTVGLRLTPGLTSGTEVNLPTHSLCVSGTTA